MKRYDYDLTINGTHYDLTPIVDSSSLVIVSPLCSEDKKSGNGTASVNLKGGANPSFYQTFMQAFLTAQSTHTVGDCLLVITDTTTNTVLHRGYLNMEEITIASGSFPEALNLASRDMMSFLDTTIRINKYWENTSRNQIVSELIDALNAETGVTIPYLSSELSDDEKIGHFAVAEGREQTYREVIDTILYEAVGFVLWYDPVDNGYRIRLIPTIVDPDETYRTIKYRLENKLNTRSAIYEKDGVLLSYPTIVERQNTNIYTHDTGNTIDDDGNLVGTEVEVGGYFPEDGDVKEIYQEYSVADRPYATGESRLENADLSLLYAKDVTYQLASKPILPLSPALPNVHWNGVAEYYPDRARILFYNNNQNPSNVTLFTLTGTAVYISALNKITVPASCAKPEEYTVQTITDSVKAKAFADWYYNSQRYGCTTSKWVEPEEGLSTIGEIVMVQHKDTGVQMPHVVVQITDSCAGGRSGIIRMKEIVAISLYGWQNVLSQTVPQSNERGAQAILPAQWYSGTALTGEGVVRGFTGRVGDYYLNTETGDVYKCVKTGSETTALWQWIMNNKGDDADITGMEVYLEYGMSVSPITFIFPDANLGYEDDDFGIDTGEELGFQNYSWESDTSAWKRGLYVWQRTRTVTPDGTTTYGVPSYCMELTQSLEDGSVFRLQPVDGSWRKNLTQPTGTMNTSVAFDIICDNLNSDAELFQFVTSVTLVPYKGGVAITERTMNVIIPISSKRVSVSFAQNEDWDSIIATVTLTISRDGGLNFVTHNLTASCSFTAVDVTQYGVYGGSFADRNTAIAWFNTNMGGIRDGYSYTDEADKVIYLYNASQGQWNPLQLSNDRASEILSMAEEDFWTLYDSTTDEEKDTLWALYGYKKEIIASAIATQRIKMYGQGVIESSSIDATKVGADGFLTEQGYRMEGASGTLRATNSYISNGHFHQGTFDSIHITGASDFHGTITTNVFETQEEDADGNTMTAVSPDASTGQAKGVRGSEIRDNIQAWANANLAKAVPSASPSVAQKTVNSVSLFNGITDVNKVINLGTVVNTYVGLDEGASSDPEQDTVFSWTNPFPCDITVQTDFVENSADYTIETPIYDWVRGLTSFDVSSVYPQNTPPPEDPQPGDYWVYFSNIEYNEDTELWEYAVTEYWYEQTGTDTDYRTEYGGYQLLINNVSVYAYSGQQFTIPPGQTIELTLWGVWVDPNWASYQLSDGFGGIYWNESWNFKSGVLFLKNSTKSFYLSDIPSGIQTGNASLVIDNTTIVSCPMNTSGAWTYTSAYGTINKLFFFAWTSAPTSYGLYTKLSSYSVTIVNSDGSSEVFDTVTSIDTTSTSITINGTRNGSPKTKTYNTSTPYLRSFNISITPIGRLRGVYSENLNPKAHNTYSLGNSQAYWLEAYISTVVQGSSKKAFKTNVSDFDKSALDIINATKIVNYTYKSDKKRNNHIGFIADDTPSELSGKDKDAMVYGDCIGVLLKAVQELSAEVDRLKGEKK